MVTFYTDIKNLEAPDSEIKLAQALSALEDDWHVLHSVFWQSKREGRQGDGEADFLLMHPKFGILVIEVKGGGIDVEHGQWITIDRYENRYSIKDPYRQAVSSKHALLDFLQEFSVDTGRLPIQHAVAFPDISTLENLGPSATKEISWTRIDLENMQAAVGKTVKHWQMQCNLSPKEISGLISLFAPTVTIRRKLSDEIADIEQEIIELTGEQIRAFNCLKSVRNALIKGGAGTGKTILAIERARRLGADGFKTLFVCYNELVGDYIASQLSDESSITALTFHKLCFSEAGKAKIKIPPYKSKEWWEKEAPMMLIEAVSANGTQFDAIIVDEGQDFCEEWLTALDLLCKDAKDPPFYIFLDTNQELYGRKWTPNDGWIVYELEINCRNTMPIAKRVSRIISSSVSSIGPDGPNPKFINIKRWAGVDSKIQEVVENLIRKEGLAPKQIKVLTNESSLVERMREIMAGEYPFTDIYGQGIGVETVARFKGLESDAIVLALNDTLASNEELERAIAYVGTSRGKSLLIVLGSGRLQSFLQWQ